MALRKRAFGIIPLIELGNGIFLRLTVELAGKYALIGIFVCLGMCAGMWGIRLLPPLMRRR